MALGSLKSVNKYLLKYKWRLLAGLVLVVASNWFAVLAPEITGYVVRKVQEQLPGAVPPPPHKISWLEGQFDYWFSSSSFTEIVAISSLIILAVAIIRGVFMFFMRQTIIVMSRHIEYDQKNEVYQHYQSLDSGFFKVNSTGDLMNRIAEDVSRVRMYTGPAIMYLVNLTTLIGFCVFNMLRKDVQLTLLVLAPLPVLAGIIYVANTIINRKSERVQALLSDLTTNAQESYSGIRVIKSFVQEPAMLGFFARSSNEYRSTALSLAKTEAVYFPSMTLMIGLSTLITIMVGGQMALANPANASLIVEFVIYINMLTFPVSAIGWTASMIQRAAASQQRINEFLEINPAIISAEAKETGKISGRIEFRDLSFTYTHTGIRAIRQLNLVIQPGEKVLLLGKTGSGKSTLLQLLLRNFEPQKGQILLGDLPLENIPLPVLRRQLGYVPQDVFLFSDTVANNIRFGAAGSDIEVVKEMARRAAIHEEIEHLDKGYETMVGERGVTLSGGQKQRISIARALIKTPEIMLFDDCLSAVDARTEQAIIGNLYQTMAGQTVLMVSHRIFNGFTFDRIVVLDHGAITETGSHEELMALNGYYTRLYHRQRTEQYLPVSGGI